MDWVRVCPSPGLPEAEVVTQPGGHDAPRRGLATSWTPPKFEGRDIHFTADLEDLRDVEFFIVARCPAHRSIRASPTWAAAGRHPHGGPRC